MNKKISFKLWLVVLWKGISQFFQKIVCLLGYKEGATFSKVIWRIFASCFAVLFLIGTIVFTYEFCCEVVYREWIRPHTVEMVYHERHLSNHVVFQDLYYRDKGRVYDENLKKVIIEDVDWVVTSDDKDSLAVFSKNGKRGYLNRFTGKIVLPAIYTRAWVFSEGLAAVEKDNELVFIDHSGNVVIDKNFDVHFDESQYTFHNGYCVVKSAVDGKSGLIDKQGNWALKPEYETITHRYQFWKVQKNGVYGLYSNNMDLIYDVVNPEIDIWDGVIEIRFPDHTAKQLDFEGNVLVDFVMDSVENMHYATTKLENYENADGYTPIYDVAKCQKYMVRSEYHNEYYGLIDRSGRRITQPEYMSIEAIAEDLYLCQPQGIIINGKGYILSADMYE